MLICDRVTRIIKIKKKRKRKNEKIKIEILFDMAVLEKHNGL